MKNNFTLTIEWKNADIYFPELENEPIIYCIANDIKIFIVRFISLKDHKAAFFRLQNEVIKGHSSGPVIVKQPR